MKRTLFIVFLLVVFSQSATADIEKKKTWEESGTIGRSNINITFPAPKSTSADKVLSTVDIDMNFSAANGDVDISLNNHNLRHYSVDTDRWQRKTVTLKVEGVGNLVVSGHISKKRWNEEARGNITATAKYTSTSVPGNILFAHGMNAEKGTWDHYADIAELYGYKVYRTDVGKCCSIADRAKMLAYYIKDQNLINNSLIAVGHSMGGLDLRYIIGKANEGTEEPFTTAAKKIKRVITIATPHGGVNLADFDPNIAGYCQPAVSNLKNEAMEGFNRRFTYPDKFKTIKTNPLPPIMPFMAFHFQCPLCTGATDCLVGTNSQTWKGAPFESGPSRTGAHQKSRNMGPVECQWELSQDDVIYAILSLDIRGVTLYADKDYSGKSEKFLSGYNIQWLGDEPIGNDTVSSLIVDDGCTATLYRDSSFRGISETFSASDHWLGDAPIGNDSVSAIKVDCM